MNNISKEEMQKLALLAKIELTQNEIEKFSEELSVIIDAVATVSAVSNSNIEPSSHPISMENVTRQDAIQASISNSQALKNAPECENGQFKVPKIINEED